MIKTRNQPIKFEDSSKQVVKKTTCYMCACRCGIDVTLVDGRVRFIKGNRDHPVNQEAVLKGQVDRSDDAQARFRARGGGVRADFLG